MSAFDKKIKDEESSIKQLKLLNDEPISESENDGLDLKKWAAVIAGTALGTNGPFTIGILGGWGVGKTSVLQLAKRFLDDSQEAKDRKISTIIFNAWQYEKERVPLIPLLASILNETEKSLPKNSVWIKKLRDAFRSLLFGISTGIKAKVPDIGELSFSIDSSKAIERYNKIQSHWIDQQVEQSLYYNAFKSLEDNGRNEQHKVIVFIDDLDRCFPEQAIHLLETIKLVLCQKGFIFVLAVDKRILESFLNKRYQNEYGMDKYEAGQCYLDKIIQLPLWIPPHDKRFEMMIEKLLNQDVFDEKQKEAFRRLKKEISMACEHNPRQLVRFLNELLVDERLYQLINTEETGEFPLGHFIIARGIYYKNESLYHNLLANDEICKELKNIDRESLEEFCKKHKEDKDLFLLKDNPLLQGLLLSDAGKKWLSLTVEDRNRIEKFLIEERYEKEWFQEELRRSIELINSSDEMDILTGCQLLVGISTGKSVPSEAKIRLNELMRIGKDHISNAAEVALRRLNLL